MNLTRFKAVQSLLAGLCLVAAPATARCAQLSYTLVEAEANPQGPVLDDPGALGDKYVSTEGDYHPALIAPVPDTGGSFVIWVRYRGEALQLKGVQGEGSQNDLNWIWDKPGDWTWKSFGRHTRADLGNTIILIRGSGADAVHGVDAALFARDDEFNPAQDLPPQQALQSVAITIDWDKTVAKATHQTYSLNVTAAFNPVVSQDKAYQANMAYMSPGLIRYHNWGMLGDSQKDPGGWLDYNKKTWDENKIRQAITGSYPYGPQRLMNIPSWPAWMDTDKDNLLDPGQTAAFADFCAKLVKIVNIDLKQKVRYWEVTNERDGPYFVDFRTAGGYGALKDPTKPDRVEELAAIYSACARAMKNVDPSIEVGGPAVARADLKDFNRRFIHAALPDLDFYSIHQYVSGDKNEADIAIYDRAGESGWGTRNIVDLLKQESPKRHIPVMLDEYNISWTWENRDQRMTDQRSAVFDALMIAQAVLNGADVTQAWNEHDGIYGKTDMANTLRPSAHLFHLYNNYLIGDVVAIATSAGHDVVAYATTDKVGKRHSLVLINRSTKIQDVRLTSHGWMPKGNMQRFTIVDAGLQASSISAKSLSGHVQTQPNTVTIFTASN